MQQLAPPLALSSFGIFLYLGARFSAFISRDAIFYKIQMRKLESFTRSRSMLTYFAQKLPQMVKKWIRKNNFRARKLFGSFEKPSPGPDCTSIEKRTLHVSQKRSRFSQQIWPLPSYHYKGAFDFAVIIQCRLLSKEWDNLTESCLATISSNVCWAASPPKHTRKKQFRELRGQNTVTQFFFRFLFSSFCSFQYSNLHLRRFKCFFQLLMSLYFIPFVLFSFSLFALFSELFVFFLGYARACVGT